MDWVVLVQELELSQWSVVVVVEMACMVQLYIVLAVQAVERKVRVQKQVPQVLWVLGLRVATVRVLATEET
jgi:hypothetical protein